jgi:hypothetical protein
MMEYYLLKCSEGGKPFQRKDYCWSCTFGIGDVDDNLSLNFETLRNINQHTFSNLHAKTHNMKKMLRSKKSRKN